MYPGNTFEEEEAQATSNRDQYLYVGSRLGR